MLGGPWNARVMQAAVGSFRHGRMVRKWQTEVQDCHARHERTTATAPYSYYLGLSPRGAIRLKHLHGTGHSRLIDGWLNSREQDEAATPNLAFGSDEPIRPTDRRVPEHTSLSPSGLYDGFHR
ncbi:hypothetical protein V502_11308 [Pseudogymnoascus sp. VKM F-4520 (FW-2644)]|nr:hypothetical protein V502_11308 [Pseudogymnoascus sp. VKM F-4520 (FW-2644)]